VEKISSLSSQMLHVNTVETTRPPHLIKRDAELSGAQMAKYLQLKELVNYAQNTHLQMLNKENACQGHVVKPKCY